MSLLLQEDVGIEFGRRADCFALVDESGRVVISFLSIRNHLFRSVVVRWGFLTSASCEALCGVRVSAAFAVPRSQGSGLVFMSAISIPCTTDSGCRFLRRRRRLTETQMLPKPLLSI